MNVKNCSLAVAASIAITAPAIAADRTILVLDASGSMWGQIEGEAKITIAQRVIEQITQGMETDAALGLYAYGHREKGKLLRY